MPKYRKLEWKRGDDGHLWFHIDGAITGGHVEEVSSNLGGWRAWDKDLLLSHEIKLVRAKIAVAYHYGINSLEK